MNTLEESKPSGWLVWFLKGTLVLVAIILFGRLAELQIIKGDYYHELSENNRIRRIPIAAARGVIKGSDGQIIVGNIPIKEKIVFSPNGFEKSLDTTGANPNDIVTEFKRNYFLGSAAAHLSGYLAEVDPEEVNKVDPNCIDKGPRLAGSLVGRSGLEEEYDCLLRGIDGQELVEVDAKGIPIRILGIKKPIAGQDLVTTIDTNLQQKVANVINTLKINTSEGVNLPGGRKGAVVITDGLGKVLSIYSFPSYNPNYFVNKNTTEINSIMHDSNLPLFNRSLDGLYHPGSTFKIVTSTAALEEGKIDEHFTFTDQGFITLNGYTYNNWYWSEYGRTEGEINLVRAIGRSTDTFFYKVGEMVGIDDLSKWANTFGLNKVTGIDLPGEAAGIIPNPVWKRQAKGELWFLGDTYNTAIGQGDVNITPLAANFLASVVANNGQICTPYLVASAAVSHCVSLGLHQQTINLIKQGMIEACETGGTGFPFFGFSPQVACKTGTAETGDGNNTHAWFTAFVPNKNFVIDVIVEKAGQGSEVAAPIAKEIMQYYLNKK